MITVGGNLNMCNKYINLQTGEELDLNKVNKIKDNALLKAKPELWLDINLKYEENKFNLFEITKGSSKTIEMICPKCNSPYQAMAQALYTGRRCPYCAGKRVNHTNSLGSLYPALIPQWNNRKNGDLTIFQISSKSNKAVWWYCNTCDSEYLSSPNTKSKCPNCPHCSNHRVSKLNSLATQNPELAKQWHPTKNGDLTPHDVTSKSSKKVWWLGECGHEWDAIIKSRKHGRGCPYCSNRKILIGYNDMWTTNPELAKLLANPEDGYKYMQWSSKRVNWKCDRCENIIRDKRVRDINKDALSCKNCSDGLSYSESLVKYLLDGFELDYNFDRKFEWSNNKRYDFYLKDLNVLIECHGKQHYNGGFHTMKGRTLKEEQENDQYKYELAMKNGIKEYIILDCRESDLRYIRTSIKESSLRFIINLNEVDWESMECNLNSSISFECLKLWNNGMRDITSIAKSLSIHKEMVRRYLKKWASLNKCDFNEFDGTKNKILQKTVQGALIREWDSVNEVVKLHFKNKGDRIPLLRVLNGKESSFDGFKWEYKEREKNSGRINSVVMLDDFDKVVGIYKTITEAGVANNYRSISHISNCCKGIRNKAYGYRWMYLEDYEKEYGKIKE